MYGIRTIVHKIYLVYELRSYIVLQETVDMSAVEILPLFQISLGHTQNVSLSASLFILYLCNHVCLELSA